MRSDIMLWLVLVGGALTAGASAVGYLVSSRKWEVPAVAGMVGGASLSVWALIGVAGTLEHRSAAFYGAAFAFAAVGGGYALASTLLLELRGRVRPVELPGELPSPVPETALFLLANVEPPTFTTRSTAAVLAELAEEGYLDASVGAMPLLFFAQKARYNAIGGTSPSLAELSHMTDAVDHALVEQDIVVDWATCSGSRRLAAQVSRAVEAGHRRLVVAELAVASSLPMTGAKNEVDLMRLEDSGVNVGYAGALGGSERVTSAVANAILERTKDPAECGVILVGHGQPNDRSRRDPVVDETETMFLNRVRMLLIERGIPEANVRVAWAEWIEPNVTSAVRHLAALGCTRVLVSPTVYPLDSLGTRLDLDVAVRQARVEESVATAVLPAWRDDPSVVAEIRALVLAAMETQRT